VPARGRTGVPGTRYCPGCLIDDFSTAHSPTPTAAPSNSAPMNPGTLPGEIPANVFENILPNAAAGLANDVDEVNHYAAPM